MSYNREKQKETATVSDASSTGTILTFTPAFPCEVVEFGVIVTTAFVKASGGVVISADFRPTAGSDTGKITGSATAGGGIMTLTNAQTVKAAGQVMKCRPASPLTVYPGQQILLNLSTGATSGAAIAFLVHRELPGLDQTNEVVVASA